jgi:hypothetical protein
MPRKRVYLIVEGIFADLISEGLYMSKVEYTYGGTRYEVFVEPEEYIELDDFDSLEEEE